MRIDDAAQGICKTAMAVSDDLRSKIAKSIYRNLVDGITDSTWEIQDNDFKNLWLGVADGVIRDLMEREHWQYGDGHTMGVRYRYVTEWTTND